MNKIKTTLRISEVDTLASTLVRLYRAAVSDGGPLAKDENLASLMAEVEKFSAGLSLAIKSDRVESSLDEADVARDGIIRDISNLLTGYASIPVPEKKAAAGRLLSIFQKYGRGIITKSYAEESSLIESMLGDFFFGKRESGCSAPRGRRGTSFLAPFRAGRVPRGERRLYRREGGKGRERVEHQEKPSCLAQRATAFLPDGPCPGFGLCGFCRQMRDGNRQGEFPVGRSRQTGCRRKCGKRCGKSAGVISIKTGGQKSPVLVVFWRGAC